MNYNPKLHNRRSIRLKGYDYSRAGLYFITICCQDRAMMFGYIKNGEMHLNDAGRMVEKWYWELENKYPDKKCHQMVVMPNHFHCIIENVKTDKCGDDGINAHIGTSLRGRPELTDKCGHHELTNECRRPEPTDEHSNENQNVPYGRGNQKIESPLGEAIGWFKTMTTNAYIKGVKNDNWPKYNQRLWQRNYCEHIIRSPQAYERISNYIKDNPQKWTEHKFNK